MMLPCKSLSRLANGGAGRAAARPNTPPGFCRSPRPSFKTQVVLRGGLAAWPLVMEVTQQLANLFEGAAGRGGEGVRDSQPDQLVGDLVLVTRGRDPSA
jgi:hypothetical protein